MATKFKFNQLSNIYYLLGSAAILLVILFVFYFSYSSFHFFTNQNNAIVITYADNISLAHQILIDKFNKLNEGKIKVEPIDLPFNKFSTNERKELLTRSLRSKSKKLDLFAIDLIWSTRFAKWAEPLDNYFGKKEQEKILPLALQSCKTQDRLVALPMYLDVSIMYYRKDLIRNLKNGNALEKRLHEGITWDEFIEISKNFNLDKNPFYIFPADNYEGLVCSYMELLLNQAPKIFVKEGFNVNTNENFVALSYLSNFIHKYNITPQIVTQFKENNCYEYFIKNNAVFLRGWPSFTKDFKNQLHDEKIDTLLIKVPLPHISGTEGKSVLGGWNIMISKYSDHKNESIKFAKFLLEEDSQKILYENGAYLPVIKIVYNEEYYSHYPELKFDKKLLENGIHRPFLENYTKLSDIISFYTNKTLKGELSIKEALIQANESISTGRLLIR